MLLQKNFLPVLKQKYWRLYAEIVPSTTKLAVYLIGRPEKIM
jgi:hypothetical protein